MHGKIVMETPNGPVELLVTTYELRSSNEPGYTPGTVRQVSVRIDALVGGSDSEATWLVAALKNTSVAKAAQLLDDYEVSASIAQGFAELATDPGGEIDGTVLERLREIRGVIPMSWVRDLEPEKMTLKMRAAMRHPTLTDRQRAMAYILLDRPKIAK